ncbi:unnamed protein product [Candidula unifasciata]|uniref:Uncharacterized protein n=1 Tax=Candidula unifasciata TaxID=100452 RepID=A0A8S3ZQ04_9EUPU|nr:unnamed protein product [Candidula unifasciata]
MIQMVMFLGIYAFPKGSMSACVIACASDNTSSLQQCSQGFKCCSIGCGKMCRRGNLHIYMRDSVCPLMKCRYMCDNVYRVNNIGCRTCECKNPCEVSHL